MMYKLASRDNIDGERFESWPSILNPDFKKFNNTIEEHIFSSEDDILNWLDSKCRTKYSNRHTNVQEFRNGDPNKLYSIYKCSNDKNTFIYSLRYKKTNETYMSYINEKNVRLKSSFKKIDNKIDFNIESIDHDNYSSAPRYINREYYEGIYPLDIDENDYLQKEYMNYVKRIHKLDIEEKQKEEYLFVHVSSSISLKWLDRFLNKLDHVENALQFFSKGGNNQINLDIEYDHKDKLNEMFRLLEYNSLNTTEDLELQINIRNMMVDPILSNNDIYQLRYDKTLLTWNKNYGYIIKTLKLMPSKIFSEIIINFSLMDFYKQIHSRENIMAMINNINEIYDLCDQPKIINKNKPKFLKIVRSFN